MRSFIFIFLFSCCAWNEVRGVPAMAEVTCGSSSILIKFNETYLDELVVDPVKTVVFRTASNTDAEVYAVGPGTACSTTDTGMELEITIADLMSCVFEETQSANSLMFTYRGVLTTTPQNDVVRDSRHIFDFTCTYTKQYDVSVAVQPFVANFNGTMATTVAMPATIQLFQDDSRTIIAHTGFNVSEKLYVSVNSGNAFDVEIIKCVSSLLNTLDNERDRRDLVVNDCPETDVLLTQKNNPSAQFEFSPILIPFNYPVNLQFKYVVCEVTICNTALNGGECVADGCTKRRRRRRRRSSPEMETHIVVSTPFRVRMQEASMDEAPVDSTTSTSTLAETSSTTTTSTISSTSTTSPTSTTISTSTTIPTSTTTTTKSDPAPKAVIPQKSQPSSPVVREYKQPVDVYRSTSEEPAVHKSWYDLGVTSVFNYVVVALMAVMTLMVLVMVYRKCRQSKVAQIRDEETPYRKF